MLAKQTAIDNGTVRMLAGVPAGDFVRDRLGFIVTMAMTVIVVMVTMIRCRCNRQMRMAWQVRVFATGPGMDNLTEELHHQVGGNQCVTANLPHRIPRGTLKTTNAASILDSAPRFAQRIHQHFMANSRKLPSPIEGCKCLTAVMFTVRCQLFCP